MGAREVVRVIIKFVGALLVSWSIFSFMNNFYQGLIAEMAHNAVIIANGIANPYDGLAFPTTQIIILAIGLTLLFAEFIKSKN